MGQPLSCPSFRYGSVVVYSCSYGRFFAFDPPVPVLASAVVYTASGYPISAKLSLRSQQPRTVIARIYYGGSYFDRVLDSPVDVYIAPNIGTPNGFQALTEVKVYSIGGDLLADVPAASQETGAQLQTVEIDSQYQASPQSFLLSYGDYGMAVSRPINPGSYMAKFYAPAGSSLYTALLASSGAVQGGTFTDPANPKVDLFPSAFVVVPYSSAPSASALVAAASLGGFPMPDIFGFARAALGFLASIPSDIATAASAAFNGLTQLGSNLWRGVYSAGMAAAGAVKAALDWSMKTKINIGPFSISVFDLAMLAVGAVVPFAAAGLVADFAVDGLLALGLSESAAAALGRLAGGLAGGALAYAIGKLSGESDSQALLDAAIAGASPFLGWKALLALSVGGALVLSAVSPSSVSSMATDNTKGEAALGSAVVSSCFDPYSSVLPMPDCLKALSASSTPLAAITYIGPEVAPGVLAQTVEVQVKNVSSVQGTFELRVTNNGRTSTAQLQIPPGGAVNSTVVLQPGQAQICVGYGGVDIDCRQYSVAAQQQQQGGQGIDLSQILALVPPIILLGAVTELVRR